MSYRRQYVQVIFLHLLLISIFSCDKKITPKPGWPVIAPETKPWTRWWWQGNALTKEGITAEMEEYQKAGLGGLEITPIYGVAGYENKFVNFLSPQWLDLLEHTFKEGERLGLGIDMATGTGWPFGGPWINSEHACKNVQYKIYELKGEEELKEKIVLIQPSYLRAIGNPIYEIDTRSGGEKPVKLDGKSLRIADINEDISKNKNLQALALEQVIFEKSLPLQTLMAYCDDGTIVDLTNKVDANGKLTWKAPKGNWKLYAVFQGWHGKMVERAGPGGEGNVIDHFSVDALKNYLNRFDSAFKDRNIRPLRAFFNDSYEVDDARGAADWTPLLFEEFKKRRGYDLRQHLPAFFGNDGDDNNKRILSDYRETISELLLENFTKPWKEWAHKNSSIVRNQAHGSPSNILDLYATVDIPEIEGIEPLRIKMASSAGNVSGKKLISSESATWLGEHFQSDLGDIKIAVDRFLLNGVNHIFYHGTNYSPPGETWPGWLFYAAVHLNPRNPQWRDFHTLNEYVARCQSFLQNSKPDNDVLLYYPIYDRFASPGPEMIEHFDGIGKQFENTVFEYASKTMLNRGFSFDYISDNQLSKVRFTKGHLLTEGNASYSTLVIPQCQFLPLNTLKKIVALAEEGATIIMLQGYPQNVSGFHNLSENKKLFSELIEKVRGKRNSPNAIAVKSVAKGRIIEGDSIEQLLTDASIRRESLVDNGILFIRKREPTGSPFYLVSNSTNKAFSGWITLQSEANGITVYDPMTGHFGDVETRDRSGNVEVYIYMNPKQTLILQTRSSSNEGPDFNFPESVDEGIQLTGNWRVEFLSGGPELPPSLEKETLQPWTSFEGSQFQNFSGSGKYSLTFQRPALKANQWIVDLGEVHESAEVILNGKSVGTTLGPVHQVQFADSVLQDTNTLEVIVSNLMANRIAYMDRHNIFWKKFYNVNFPSRQAENRKNGLFNASSWEPKISGLGGPVKLKAVSIR